MIVEPLPTSGHYELQEALDFPGGFVPPGFTWDGASIPRLAWTVLGYSPFHPALMRASCVHDYLYMVREGSRRDADEMFRSLLLEDGVPESPAMMMFAAVREYGMLVWMDDEDKAEMERRAHAELRRIQEAP